MRSLFGNARGVAATLNVDAPGHPMTEDEVPFAGDRVTVLRGEHEADFYALMRAVASDDVS